MRERLSGLLRLRHLAGCGWIGQLCASARFWQPVVYAQYLPRVVSLSIVEVVLQSSVCLFLKFCFLLMRESVIPVWFSNWFCTRGNVRSICDTCV